MHKPGNVGSSYPNLLELDGWASVLNIDLTSRHLEGKWDIVSTV